MSDVKRMTAEQLAGAIRSHGTWHGPDEMLDELERRAVEHWDLQASAMRLVNLNRWSYGGPVTLRQLVEQIEKARESGERS